MLVSGFASDKVKKGGKSLWWNYLSLWSLHLFSTLLVSLSLCVGSSLRSVWRSLAWLKKSVFFWLKGKKQLSQLSACAQHCTCKHWWWTQSEKQWGMIRIHLSQTTNAIGANHLLPQLLHLIVTHMIVKMILKHLLPLLVIIPLFKFISRRFAAPTHTCLFLRGYEARRPAIKTEQVICTWLTRHTRFTWK